MGTLQTEEETHVVGVVSRPYFGKKMRFEQIATARVDCQARRGQNFLQAASSPSPEITHSMVSGVSRERHTVPYRFRLVPLPVQPRARPEQPQLTQFKQQEVSAASVCAHDSAGHQMIAGILIQAVAKAFVEVVHLVVRAADSVVSLP